MSLTAAGGALSAALVGHGPRLITVEVPPSPQGGQGWWSTVLSAAPEAVLCLPPEGRRMWGRGVARRLQATAHEAEVQALWHGVELVGPPSPPPALFAALPFDAAAPAGALWAPFSGGGLFLPRWAWEEVDGRAFVRVFVEDPEAERPHVLEEWRTLSRASPVAARPPRDYPQSDTLDEADWQSLIGSALRFIREGRVEKVVLARTATYGLPAPVPVTTALARLRASQPHCTVFALRMGESTFMGATPERLVKRTGRKVQTDALAGTGPQPEALLASGKDQREHKLVVDAIVAALQPRCAWLDWRVPEIVQLRDLCHLRTRIEGELRGSDTALTLARALQPTPAVGGVPRDAALAIIQALERTPRGLYAGPVGWLDQSGDGALWVALRSGVLTGQTLRLFAGVGVVAGSTPQGELVETMRKMAAMEAAFSP